MTGEPDLRMIALYRDSHLDGPELRRIHLQFRAVQIVTHHPRHAVGQTLPKLRRIHPRGDLQCRRRGRIGGAGPSFKPCDSTTSNIRKATNVGEPSDGDLNAE